LYKTTVWAKDTQLEYHIFEKRLKVNDEKINLMQEAVQAISMIKMMAAEQFWYKRIHKVQDQEFKRLVQARLIAVLAVNVCLVTRV
jgi:ABC-type bacteriocin/lantibiotic exporter with double-glycine peptidase domain